MNINEGVKQKSSFSNNVIGNDADPTLAEVTKVRQRRMQSNNELQRRSRIHVHVYAKADIVQRRRGQTRRRSGNERRMKKMKKISKKKRKLGGKKKAKEKRRKEEEEQRREEGELRIEGKEEGERSRR